MSARVQTPAIWLYVEALIRHRTGSDGVWDGFHWPFFHQVAGVCTR